LYLQETVDDLQKAMAKAKPAMYPSRQRFTLPLAEGEKKATVLAGGKKLSDYGLTDGSKVVFKDLGPQVPRPRLPGC
jgi:very-long-chain enoyl-CoA reductase